MPGFGNKRSLLYKEKRGAYKISAVIGAPNNTLKTGEPIGFLFPVAG